jgi:hypothetical protein
LSAGWSVHIHTETLVIIEMGKENGGFAPESDYFLMMTKQTRRAQSAMYAAWILQQRWSVIVVKQMQKGRKGKKKKGGRDYGLINLTIAMLD